MEKQECSHFSFVCCKIKKYQIKMHIVSRLLGFDMNSKFDVMNLVMNTYLWDVFYAKCIASSWAQIIQENIFPVRTIRNQTEVRQWLLRRTNFSLNTGQQITCKENTRKKSQKKEKFWIKTSECKLDREE